MHEDNIYYQNNPQYFMELLQLVQNNVRSYFSILKTKFSKKCGKSFKYLYDWINDMIPLLKSDYYKISTKVNWILTGRTDFPICKNPNCPNFGKKYGQKHNLKVFESYFKHCSIACGQYDVETQQKIERTNLKTKGITRPYLTENAKQKAKQKCLLSNNRPSLYFYDNKHFNALPELAYYIWLKDNNINFEYEPKSKIMIYYDKYGKEHVYKPDFWIIDSNEIHEIKGDNHFDKNTGVLINISDKTKNYIAEAKYKCMIENNVKIIKTIDYNKYLKYCYGKFGSRNQFRRIYRTNKTYKSYLDYNSYKQQFDLKT